MSDDFYRKLIKPIRDSRIADIISAAGPGVYSPYDEHLNFKERLEPIEILRKTFTQWSSNLIKGLESFRHMYVMNGNTDSLNRLFSSTDNLSWKKGEYSYYSYWHKLKEKSFNELTSPKEVDDLVVTWPGYSNGNCDEINFALQCGAKRLHLDCAYLGLTKPSDVMDVSKFETASFSFSKSLAIPYNRISILFSKKELHDVSLMNKLGYVNLSGVKLATHIMKHLPADYWWNVYGNKMKELCEINNLTPTDSILFSYDGGNRIGLSPYWNNYE